MRARRVAIVINNSSVLVSTSVCKVDISPQQNPKQNHNHNYSYSTEYNIINNPQQTEEEQSQVIPLFISALKAQGGQQFREDDG